jgi:hypothetical protein
MSLLIPWMSANSSTILIAATAMATAESIDLLIFLEMFFMAVRASLVVI